MGLLPLHLGNIILTYKTCSSGPEVNTEMKHPPLLVGNRLTQRTLSERTVGAGALTAEIWPDFDIPVLGSKIHPQQGGVTPAAKRQDGFRKEPRNRRIDG